MLMNAPTLAIVAVDTEENEPSRVQVKNNEITCTHYLVPSGSGHVRANSQPPISVN